MSPHYSADLCNGYFAYAIVFCFFGGGILGLFTNDGTVVQTAFYPFCVMLSTFVISVPAYTYCNTVIGTGNTRMVFVFQMMNMSIYLFYLFLLSRSPAIPLAVYWTSEQLYVVVLLGLSLVYLKWDKWQDKSLKF